MSRAKQRATFWYDHAVEDVFAAESLSAQDKPPTVHYPYTPREAWDRLYCAWWRLAACQ